MANTSRVNTTFGRSIDQIGWAMFFMWVGVALLGDFSWTVSLVGTAAIILAVQATLYFRGERLDVFMAAVALVLLLGVVTDPFGSVWSLFPALLLVIGIAMLADALRTPSSDRVPGHEGNRERI